MAFRDQQKYLDYLRKFESIMDPKELDEYKMFVKRQKDDEDFDTVSMGRLKALYEKFYKYVNSCHKSQCH